MKGIIFDKDGTLMQFEPFWGGVARAAIREIAREAEISDLESVIEQAIGLTDNGIDTAGILCAGTYAQMAETVNAIVSKSGKSFRFTARRIAEIFEKNIGYGEVLPTCESLAELLEGWKRRGYLLFLATTDDATITEYCLKGLSIADKFERLYTDDGSLLTKPAPDIIFEIERDFGLKEEDLYMVGDTMTDVLFAKNGKIKSVCVGRGVAGREANYAVDDVSRLDEIIEV